jgi:dienelactone hydrolase
MFKHILHGAALAAILACSAAAQPAPSGGPRLPSASDFGRLPAIDSVTISPDGKHIAAITTLDGTTARVSVWATDAMDQPPYIINPSDFEGFRFVSVEFVKNDRMVVTFRQLIANVNTADGSKHQDFLRRSILMSPTPGGPPNAEILPPNLAAYTGSKQRREDAVVAVLNTLPGDPKKIIVEDFRVDRTIYKVDVDTAQTEVLQYGSDKYSFQLNAKGEVVGREYLYGDGGDLHQSMDFKNPKTGAWEEAFRWFFKDRASVGFSAFDDDPNVVLAESDQGRDKSVILAYDIASHKPPEVAFEHPLFEAGGVIRSRRSGDYQRVLGFSYESDIRRIYWTDGRFASLEREVRKALGVQMDKTDWVDPTTGKRAKIDTIHDFDIRMVGFSDDLSKILVVKSGPKLPPEYYLLKDGKTLSLLGKAFPTIDPAVLGDTRLVEYPARDGLMIPAFLTTPSKALYGPGPYPTLITPHGGPWARDSMEWDTTGWTQYFAARGYAVIQPQYRGSQGWGQKLWRAGDREWGGKMEDDLDDGAKWLIAQGVAAPDRIAVHGYSYGGYAALDASVRANGLYQCAIAGAGVAEMDRFQERSSVGPARQYQWPTLAGVSPLAHIDQVTIPVMAYHGDSDHNVPVSESKRFTDALKAAHKPYRFVELQDMGHEITKWSPQNKRDVLQAVDDFLKTGCKPGGL